MVSTLVFHQLKRLYPVLKQQKTAYQNTRLLT